MLRSFSYGLLAYAVSAVVFVLFSVFFVRSYGADTYGAFSLLLNTVSALTMFGNYHGALVAYAPAVDRGAFRAMMRSVLIYAVVAAVVSAAILSAFGSLRNALFVPVAVAFVFIVVSGLPTSAVLASPANWAVNIARAVYQALLILAFWGLFALGSELGTSFALALLLAAAVYLAILGKRVDLSAPPPTATMPAPRLILLMAMFWNLAHMAVMLTDKFAIRYMNIGADSADIGVFLLYLDIAGRFSAVYVIGLAPLTYELLRRVREGKRIGNTARGAIGVCLLVGTAVTAVGYLVIPPLYGTQLAGREWLPAVVGVYVTLLGFNSVFLAYCNSSGRPGLLLCHYAGVFAAGGVALAVLYFANGQHLSITGLAVVLALGQCFLIVSIGVLSCRRGRATPVVSRGLESAVPAPVRQKVR